MVLNNKPHPDHSSLEIRTRLRDDLKQSMRSKDTFRTTTIRSVLAEITNADKSNKDKPISQDAVYAILQKSIARRNDSASQFRSASRADLAEKEEGESAILTSFLPPQLSDSEIDQRLQTAFASLQGATGGNPGAVVGKILKAFYETTERASVKVEDVSRRAKEIVQAAASGKQ
ncbi:YqeY domain-containing protein [Ceratobasidium sp. AG-Ba]|nr:YqeY domain-containing protein [Ceratobasidium sp. AG-Ba]